MGPSGQTQIKQIWILKQTWCVGEHKKQVGTLQADTDRRGALVSTEQIWALPNRRGALVSTNHSGTIQADTDRRGGQKQIWPSPDRHRVDPSGRHR